MVVFTTVNAEEWNEFAFELVRKPLLDTSYAPLRRLLRTIDLLHNSLPGRQEGDASMFVQACEKGLCERV